MSEFFRSSGSVRCRFQPTLSGSVFLSLTSRPSSITDCIHDTARSMSTSIMLSLKWTGNTLILSFNTIIRQTEPYILLKESLYKVMAKFQFACFLVLHFLSVWKLQLLGHCTSYLKKLSYAKIGQGHIRPYNWLLGWPNSSKAVINLKSFNIWATSWENLFITYANNKGADQPALPHSLISTFVVHCLDSIICLVSISEISSI